MAAGWKAIQAEARAFAQKGEIGRAIHRLNDALQVAPEQPAIYEDLFSFCLLASSPKSAVQAAEELRRLRPNDASYVYMHGIATLASGEVPAARAILEEAVRRAPRAWEPRQALAQVLKILKEPARARELLEEAVRHSPTEPGPANDLALSYLEEPGGAARARAVLERVLAAHPGDPATSLNLALASAESDPASARRHAEAARKSEDAGIREQAERLLKQLLPS